MDVDDLFNPSLDEGWRKDAIVGGIWCNEGTYAIGYHQAADALVEDALATHRMDLFFYPICYLYCHALEITLKLMIRETERLIQLSVHYGDISREQARDAKDMERGLYTHDLEQLLGELERRLKLVPEGEVPSEVREAVMLLTRIEGTTEAFRYPTLRKTGTASLPDVKQVDLRLLRDRMSLALGALTDGLWSWLYERIQLATDLMEGFGHEEPGF